MRSRRWRAGSRRNKRRRDVGSFASDRKQADASGKQAKR